MMGKICIVWRTGGKISKIELHNERPDDKKPLTIEVMKQKIIEWVPTEETPAIPELEEDKKIIEILSFIEIDMELAPVYERAKNEFKDEFDEEIKEALFKLRGAVDALEDLR